MRSFEEQLSDSLEAAGRDIHPTPRPLSPTPRRQRPALLPIMVLTSAIVLASGALAVAVLVPRGSMRLFAVAGRPGDGAAEFVVADLEGAGAEAIRGEPIAGLSPAIAATSDGRLAFIAAQTDAKDDDVPTSDVLRILDVETGDSLGEVALYRQDSALQRFQTLNPLPPPTIVASPAGEYVFVMLFTQGSADEQRFYLGTVDVGAQRMLPDVVPMGECGPSYQLVALGGARVAALCSAQPRVMLIEVSDTGSAASVTDVDLQLPKSSATDYFGSQIDLNLPAGGFRLADGSLQVVTLGGDVLRIDPAGGQVRDGALPLPEGRSVSLGQVAQSLSGYLVVGLRDLTGTDAVNSREALIAAPGAFDKVRSIRFEDSPARFIVTSAQADSVASITESGQLLLIDPEAASLTKVNGLSDERILYAIVVSPTGEEG